MEFIKESGIFKTPLPKARAASEASKEYLRQLKRLSKLYASKGAGADEAVEMAGEALKNNFDNFRSSPHFAEAMHESFKNPKMIGALLLAAGAGIVGHKMYKDYQDAHTPTQPY